ncbi:MAG: hypothetical protein ACO3JG_11420, partial [Luteolibacter sp.]
MIAFLEQRVALVAELGKGLAAFFQFLQQAGNAQVGGVEFLGFLFELVLERVELAAPLLEKPHRFLRPAALDTELAERIVAHLRGPERALQGVHDLVVTSGEASHH